MPPLEQDKRRIIAWVKAGMFQVTQKTYCINLDALDDESLHEFMRLLRDIGYQKQLAVLLARFISCVRGK